MESDVSQMWSLAADWTQALAAVGGLGFIGWQIWQSRKASDLQILMDFLQKFKEHESALVEADHDDVKRQAFTELLNFLEVCAVTLNNELLQKNSRNIDWNRPQNSKSTRSICFLFSV